MFKNLGEVDLQSGRNGLIKNSVSINAELGAWGFYCVLNVKLI